MGASTLARRHVPALQGGLHSLECGKRARTVGKLQKKTSSKVLFRSYCRNCVMGSGKKHACGYKKQTKAILMQELIFQHKTIRNRTCYDDSV
jgi:hypothetical protein